MRSHAESIIEPDNFIFPATSSFSVGDIIPVPIATLPDREVILTCHVLLVISTRSSAFLVPRIPLPTDTVLPP